MKKKWIQSLCLLVVFFFCISCSFSQGKNASKNLKICYQYYNDSCLYNEAILYGKKALLEAEMKKDHFNIVRSLKYIGLSYTRNYIDYDTAEIYLEKAKEIGKKYGFSDELKEIELGIGCNQLSRGNLLQASEILFRTLRVFEKDKNLEMIAKNQYEIGRLYRLQGKPFMAEKQSYRAFNTFTKAKDHIGESYTYIGLISCYVDQHDFKKALRFLNKSVELFPNLKYGFGRYRYLNEASTIYAYLHDFPKAIEYCKEGIELTDQLNLPMQKEDFVRRLGYIYMVIGETEKTEEIGKMILESTLKHKEKIHRMYNYRFLSEMCFAAKDYKKTCEYRGKFERYKDSVMNETNDRKIAELKTVYDTEKKDQQLKQRKGKIILLQKEKELANYRFYWLLLGLTTVGLIVLLIFNYSRAKLKREKIEANYQKELVELEASKKIKALEIQILHAQMNPHFVFNCLSAIQHLFMSGDQMEGNAKLSSFARLLRMSIDHVKRNFVSLEDELKFLKHYIDLEQLQFDIPFDYELVNESSSSLDEIEIPSMIIQPYVENAINHGLKNKNVKGKLILRITENKESLCIEIDDNGVGREKAGEIKKMSAHNHVSKGLQLVQEKIEVLREMNGLNVNLETIDKFDEDGEPIGTKVVVCFPKLYD